MALPFNPSDVFNGINAVRILTGSKPKPENSSRVQDYDRLISRLDDLKNSMMEQPPKRSEVVLEPSPVEEYSDLPTTDETIQELKRRLGKELYRMELDLAGGGRIAGKSCDCLSSKHHFGIEATAEELMAYERNPIYNQIVSWLGSHASEFEPAEIIKHPVEFYQKLIPEVRAFRKAVMGTETLRALLNPSTVAEVERQAQRVRQGEITQEEGISQLEEWQKASQTLEEPLSKALGRVDWKPQKEVGKIAFYDKPTTKAKLLRLWDGLPANMDAGDVGAEWVGEVVEIIESKHNPERWVAKSEEGSIFQDKPEAFTLSASPKAEATAVAQSTAVDIAKAQAVVVEKQAIVASIEAEQVALLKQAREMSKAEWAKQGRALQKKETQLESALEDAQIDLFDAEDALAKLAPKAEAASKGEIGARIEKPIEEVDALSYAPPGPRWEGDMGAQPGEPVYYLDGIENPKAAIIEIINEQHEVLYQVVTGKASDARTLGLYNTLGKAAQRAEEVFPSPKADLLKLYRDVKHWYRGSISPTTGDTFYSSDKEVAAEFAAPTKLGGKAGIIEELRAKPQGIYAAINKEDLALELGITESQTSRAFDVAVREKLQPQGYDAVYYSTGTFESGELHVFGSKESSYKMSGVPSTK